MNHETLQALYALDVAEVGEIEAAKKWEYFNGVEWVNNKSFNAENSPAIQPSWIKDQEYRRKPDLPWPKVMMPTEYDELVEKTVLAGRKEGWAACESCHGIDPVSGSKIENRTPVGYVRAYALETLSKPGHTVIDAEPQSSDDIPLYAHPPSTIQWSTDAPEWANKMLIVFWDGKTEHIDGKQERLVIERPKPVLKKIDWSNLPPAVASRMSPAIHKDGPLSGWIAWNCDQDTLGNPLPDGLMMEWYEETHSICLTNTGRTPNWKQVTRFRIVGIQEGWE